MIHLTELHDEVMSTYIDTLSALHNECLPVVEYTFKRKDIENSSPGYGYIPMSVFLLFLVQ